MAVTKRPAAAPPARRASAAAATSGASGKLSGKPNGVAADYSGQAASLNPDDFTQGGLLDDMDVTFVECRFTEWDYNGVADKPALCLLVTMEYDDQDEAKTQEQYYSAGDLSRFIPSEDGKRAISVAGARGLNSNTNAALLLKSVIEQGFPVDKFGDGDVSAMDGMQCHINRVPQPKRGGAIQNVNSQGFDKTVAIVTKINKLPWEAAPVGGKKAAPAPIRPASAGKSGISKPVPAPEGGLDDEAAEILVKVLADKNGSIKKASVAGASFRHLAGNENRSGILQLLADPEFLARGEDYGWTFDGTTIESA